MTTFLNILTITRILIGAVIFILLMFDSFFLLALILFIIAGLSDYFDGYLARKFDATSQIGEILDPIADKILIVFLFFGLALNLSSYIIGFAGALIISREIWVSALRDFNARKIKTSVQLFTLFTYLLALAVDIMLLIILADILIVIAALITLYTGYLYTYNTFKN